MPYTKGIPLLICVLYGAISLLLAAETEKDSLHDISKRSANASLSFLPADFPLDSLKNATPIACSDVITIPTIKVVRMSTAQMRTMFEDMGGSYVREYMASTQAEAAANFPNLIMLSEMFQNSSQNDSVSVYDNFVSKQVIVEDLQKLMFYFLNKTNANGQPEMEMKTKINSAFTTPTTNTRPLTPSTYPTPVPIYTKKSTQSYMTPPTVLQNTTYGQRLTDVMLRHSTAQAQATDPQQSHVTASMTSPDSSLPNETLLTTSPTSTSTTLDPDVAKSLEQFHNYLDGRIFVDLGQNLTSEDLNLDTVWKEANTTLHPSVLLGLVDQTHSARMKRNAPQYDDALNGSYTREEYCQLKGALTSDRKFVHMCSSCAATTRLTENYFPRYINEAVCKTNDTSCFTIGPTSHGQCKQNMFTLKVMRRRRGHCSVVLHNGQTLAVDDWQIVHKAIRVACECTINKLSVFKQFMV